MAFSLLGGVERTLPPNSDSSGALSAGQLLESVGQNARCSGENRYGGEGRGGGDCSVDEVASAGVWPGGRSGERSVLRVNPEARVAIPPMIDAGRPGEKELNPPLDLVCMVLDAFRAKERNRDRCFWWLAADEPLSVSVSGLWRGVQAPSYPRSNSVKFGLQI